MSGRSKLLSMKLKLCVGVVVTVAAAVAVVCFVSLNHPVSGAKENRSSHKRSLELEPEENSFVASEPEVVERHRRQSPLVRAGTSSQQEKIEMDCYSFPNKTIPAAHIKSRGHRFKKPTSSTSVPGYQQQWICSDMDPMHPYHPIHAFVDGGMTFLHDNNKLQVPTCGYYHISSQILFEFDSKSRNGHTYVSHLLKFMRNCHWREDNAQLVKGVSSIHPGNVTTTFASDVVKLCEGGTVWVEIPETVDDNLYPRGDDHATFITAVLIAETSCHWPLTTMTMMENPDQSHD